MGDNKLLDILKRQPLSDCPYTYSSFLDETQRLLDSAVEDNLIKLENKIGTKGTKSGIEEKAYRLPTLDMLPRERHDW